MTVPVGAVALATAAAVFAQDVLVKLSGDQLQVSAPAFHFLTGKPLEHLKNGNSIPFDIQVSLLTDGKMTVLRRSFERFVVSYDVWEERFSVARMRSSRATISHLSASAAEAWCMNKFSLSTAGVPEDKPFWVRIDIRAQLNRDKGQIDEDNGGLSLSTLIDIFSRQSKASEASQWRADSEPVRLGDLRRAAAK
jgi:hypothetical protein